MTNAIATTHRSEKFYMDTVIFKVEDTLFKVPKSYFVKNSSIFRDMFTLPQADQANHEGSSDDHPLVLEHVQAEVFAELLQYMYPEQVHYVTVDNTPKRFPYKTEELFLELIDLARRWMFRGLHAQLIREHGYSLKGDDAQHLVIVGKKYGIPQWLRNGYHLLATQTNPPSLHDAKTLGWEDAVRIFHLREKFAFYRLPAADRHRQVLEAFAEDIQVVENEYQEFYNGPD